jgi:hypothetical protein
VAPPELGPWDPLDLPAAVELFEAAGFPWWISGGRALELHLGRSWREHDDTDVGILRRDAADLASVLTGWDIQVAAGGQLGLWSGEGLRADSNQNNLWCRRRPNEPWSLDVTINEGDDRRWVYRRNPSVRVPWAVAVLRTPDGVPYLAPELQLLFKSKGHRPKDDLDAAEAITELSDRRREWLARHLDDTDPWQELLRDG